jgi:DNA-binding response OmpR family regulator
MENKTLLVVEDDHGIINILTEIFKVYNIKTIFARNGASALAVCADNDIDTILCDYMLPDFNGNIVLQEIRNGRKKANIPFIFLSAFADPDDIKKGLEAGANEYIIKPFSAKNLVDTIKKYMNAKVN